MASSDSERVTVLLVDDHAVVREGYRRLLERHGDIVVVGEAANAAEAHELFCRVAPQIVVMDITLPGLSYYHGSKFALEGISESLGKEVKDLGIKVTAVEPGPAVVVAAAAAVTSPRRAPPAFWWRRYIRSPAARST